MEQRRFATLGMLGTAVLAASPFVAAAATPELVADAKDAIVKIVRNFGGGEEYHG